MTPNKLILAHGLNMDLFAGEGENDWNEAWGYPETHQFLLPLTKPGDSVLDIGFGSGRSSFPFALAGAKIFAVEPNPSFLHLAADRYENAGLTFEVKHRGPAADFLSRNHNVFDIVILSDVLTHLLKSEGQDLVLQASLICRKYLLVTAPSVFSYAFEYHQEYNFGHPESCTYLDECSCSGEDRIEPFSYYFPGEIESLILTAGGRILAAQTHGNNSGNFNWVVVAGFTK